MNDEINERPPVPEAIADRPPTMDQCAKETYSLPADWQVSRWERKGNSPDFLTCRFFEMEGAVYKQLITRGPRKGQTNWRKPEPGTHTVVAVSPAQIDAWMLKWEAETGYCHECTGTGFAWHGWNHERGVRYRSCKRCNETGLAPGAERGVKFHDSQENAA